MRRPGPRITNRGRLVGLAVELAIVVALGALLWPQRFGGRTAITVVSGHSMEPTYHDGDTLLVRSISAARVGDIVVYQISDGLPGAGHLVVHRLTGITPEMRYTLQGDNRATADDVHPSPADVIGSPIANLGPLPSRILAILPRIAAALIALGVTLRLWPPPVDTPPTPVGQSCDA